MSEPTYTLLVVDDEATNISIISAILADEYRILAATDGLQGIALAEEHRPDAILLDVMMPRMNGIEVCKVLKKKPYMRDIPILFVTALDDMANEEVGFKVGAADYISKPLHPAVLKARLKIHIRYWEQIRFLEKLLAQRVIDAEDITQIQQLLQE